MTSAFFASIISIILLSFSRLVAYVAKSPYREAAEIQTSDNIQIGLTNLRHSGVIERKVWLKLVKHQWCLKYDQNSVAGQRATPKIKISQGLFFCFFFSHHVRSTAVLLFIFILLGTIANKCFCPLLFVVLVWFGFFFPYILDILCSYQPHDHLGAWKSDILKINILSV